MKKITDKDVEALKAGKKVTKGFIHMQLDDKGSMKLKFKTELRDDYKQEMVNAEQRDIQHKTDKGTYRQISRRGDGYSGSIRQKQRYRDDNQRS